MRTDAIIDDLSVICPNASTLGYAKLTARRGDLIRYEERYVGGASGDRLARVIGRIAYAPALSETPAIKNFLLVLALSDSGTFCYERWIDPKDVREVNAFPAKLFAFFAAPLKYDAQMYRRLSDYGTLSEQYIDKADDHVQEWSKERA